MPSAFILAAAVCDLLAAAGTAYFAMAIWAAKRFQKERVRAEDRDFAPPVSILKSLKGLDPNMYQAFRSHCLVDYPEYEMLFGAHDPGELALTLVEKLQQEFPERSLRIIHCPEVLGLNGKVSNLVQMLPQARYEHVIINDSDILVPRNYLRRVLAPFADPHVGMVTTLYRGMPNLDWFAIRVARTEQRLHRRGVDRASAGTWNSLRSGCDPRHHQGRSSRDRRARAARRLSW